MKSEEFTRSDGSKGESFTPEVDDKVVALRDKVGTRENLVVKDGKAIKIENHFLEVNYEDKPIFIKITGGQKLRLDKAGDLTNKTITFYKYVNKFGDQIGARVEKTEK